MPTTLGSRNKMMHIDEDGILASRDDAPAAIAPHDLTPQARRHVLTSRTLARFRTTHVGGV